MANKVLSIEVGYGITKVVEMEYKVKKPKVYHCFSFETPIGIVEDGVMQQSELFKKLLKSKCAERGIKTNKVVFTIASSKIATREVALPLVKENKIKDVLLTNIQEYFPVDLSMYKITHKILEKNDTKEQQGYRVLIVAIPILIIRSYQQLAQACDLHLVNLDYVGNSVVQAVSETYKNGTNLMIKIDEKTSMLTILKDGELDLQRTIGYGMDEAINTIMESTAYGERLDYANAIAILQNNNCIRRRIDVTEEYKEEEDTNEEVCQARTEITESLRYLVSSILRVIDYYSSAKPDAKIDKIVVMGLGTEFGGLKKLLTNELSQKVTSVQSLESVNITQGIINSSFNISEYVACLGATASPLEIIHEKDAKNWKKDKVKSETTGGNMIVGYILLGVSVVAIGGMLALSIPKYIGEKNQNKVLDARIEELKPVEKIHKEYMRVKNEFNEYTEMFKLTENPNDQLIAFIKELEEKMPTQINVLSFDTSSEGVNMNIKVANKEAVAKVLLQLQTFESLLTVETSSVTEEKNEVGQVAVSFSVNCTYAPYSSISEEEETTTETEETTQEGTQE